MYAWICKNVCICIASFIDKFVYIYIEHTSLSPSPARLSTRRDAVLPPRNVSIAQRPLLTTKNKNTG